MAAELQNKPELQPLAAQFVLLKLDVKASPDWKTLSNRYEFEGDGVPVVMVVRADGQQLYGKSGAPKDLMGFLSRRLDDAGKILSPKKLAEMDQALKKARLALKKKEIPQVVKTAIKHADSGSYDETSLAFDNLLQKLEEDAQSAFLVAKEKLKSDNPEKQLEGALSLVELNRQYGRLPEFFTTVQTALEKFRNDSKKAEFLSQAELIDQARLHRSERKWDEALASFEKVAEKFPKTEAAQLARAEIPDLRKRSQAAKGSSTGKSKVASSAGSGDGGEGDKEEKAEKAASLLKFAKVFSKSKPEKAREYLEKVVNLAPDSPAGKEAQKLLKDLE